MPSGEPPDYLGLAMNTDFTPIIPVVVLLLAFGGMVAGFFLFRSRGAERQKENLARATETERTATAERRRRELEAEKVLAALVAAGTHLPTGKLRCQASPNCSEVATHPRPRVTRDDGWRDFLRRGFGAPRRYRMEMPDALKMDGTIEKKTAQPAKYCDIHVHIAQQVCLEQLASDEHAEAAAQADREARLTYFESAGLDKRVAKVVSETELRDSDKKRRKPAEAEKNNVVPFGRAANGSASMPS